MVNGCVCSVVSGAVSTLESCSVGRGRDAERVSRSRGGETGGAC